MAPSNGTSCTDVERARDAGAKRDADPEVIARASARIIATIQPDATSQTFRGADGTRAAATREGAGTGVASSAAAMRARNAGDAAAGGSTASRARSAWWTS